MTHYIIVLKESYTLIQCDFVIDGFVSAKMSELVSFGVALIITFKITRYLFREFIDKIFVVRPDQGINKNAAGDNGIQNGDNDIQNGDNGVEVGSTELVTFQSVTNENDIAETLEVE